MADIPDIGAYEVPPSIEVKLGPEDDFTALPKLMWLKGSPPSWTVSSNKQTEEAVMSDKSRRIAFFDEKREWSIGLGYLSRAQLDSMKAKNALKQILYFVNYNEDTVCYEVYISSFRYEPERMDIRQLKRWKIEMALREV